MINYFIVYFLISLLILFLITKISYKCKLIDMPDRRKMHILPTAYTGGLALSLIYLFSIYLFEISYEKLNLILSIGFLIGVVGLIDDRLTLNVGGKLSLQIIPIIYLIILKELNLTDLGDYDYFKIELNSFSIPFTILSILFLINSFNYFDGLDGSLSFTTVSTLIILYFLSDDVNIKLFLILIIIPILLFLCFNFSIFSFQKLFLGDGGSLLLGFIIAFTLIFLANQKIVHPILLAFSVSIFVYEFLAVNLLRLKNNKNPFKAGQDHLHHIVFKKTKSIFITNCFLFFSNIIIFFIGFFSFLLISPIASLVIFMCLFIIFLNLRSRFYLD